VVRGTLHLFNVTFRLLCKFTDWSVQASMTYGYQRIDGSFASFAKTYLIAEE